AIVPDCEREHSTQPRYGFGTPDAVRPKHDLGIAIGPEPLAARLELSAQLAEVVDHPVENDGCIPVWVAHWLMTRRCGIDDRQPPRPEHDRPLSSREDANPLAVGPPGNHVRAHRRHGPFCVRDSDPDYS